jgi:hypothetical protein
MNSFQKERKEFNKKLHRLLEAQCYDFSPGSEDFGWFPKEKRGLVQALL